MKTRDLGEKVGQNNQEQSNLFKDAGGAAWSNSAREPPSGRDQSMGRKTGWCRSPARIQAASALHGGASRLGRKACRRRAADWLEEPNRDRPRGRSKIPHERTDRKSFFLEAERRRLLAFEKHLFLEHRRSLKKQAKSNNPAAVQGLMQSPPSSFRGRTLPVATCTPTSIRQVTL